MSRNTKEKHENGRAISHLWSWRRTASSSASSSAAAAATTTPAITAADITPAITAHATTTTTDPATCARFVGCRRTTSTWILAFEASHLNKSNAKIYALTSDVGKGVGGDVAGLSEGFGVGESEAGELVVIEKIGGVPFCVLPEVG